MQDIEARLERTEAWKTGSSRSFHNLKRDDYYFPRPLTRHTEPEPELKLLLERLRLELPAQPPPKITATQAETATPV